MGSTMKHLMRTVAILVFVVACGQQAATPPRTNLVEAARRWGFPDADGSPDEVHFQALANVESELGFLRNGLMELGCAASARLAIASARPLSPAESTICGPYKLTWAMVVGESGPRFDVVVEYV